VTVPDSDAPLDAYAPIEALQHSKTRRPSRSTPRPSPRPPTKVSGCSGPPAAV